MHQKEKNIYKKILKTLPQVEKELSKKICKDIETAYKGVISDFYRNYEPHRYMRQGNPFREVRGLYDGLKVRRKNGRIDYETNFLFLTGKYDSPVDAFNNAYSYGIHGSLKYVPDHVMSPSPESIFDKTLENYYFVDDAVRIWRKYLL